MLREVAASGHKIKGNDHDDSLQAKVGITGEDFDGKGIMVVVVPGQKGIKLITAFYT